MEALASREEFDALVDARASEKGASMKAGAGESAGQSKARRKVVDGRWGGIAGAGAVAVNKTPKQSDGDAYYLVEVGVAQKGWGLINWVAVPYKPEAASLATKILTGALYTTPSYLRLLGL